jgi:putative ABC transport system permease protein
MGASLMIRTSWSLARIDPGFRAGRVLTSSVSPSRVKYPRPENLIALYDELLERIRAVPGVEAAGAVRALPLASELGDWGLEVEGYSPPAGESVQGDWQIATPGYFEAMGIPLRQGRFFTAADRRDAQPVIVVSEAMARRFWPGQDPIGRRIRVRGPGARRFSTVVGVAGDVRHNGLTAELKGAWYLPRAQFDLSAGSLIPGMTLVVKTAGDPAAAAAPVRAAIHAIDSQLPVADVRPLEEVVSGALGKQRFTTFFLLLCSALALTLAALGVYGVVRFRVGARTREIGLRMALGAPAGRVVARVVSQSMGLVAAGLGVGILAALGLTRFLAGLLYGVKASDPLTLLATATALSLAALAATWLPARRAARVDPIIVLRED